MPKEEDYFYKIGEQLDEAQAGKLFGKPCFKINGKAFVCFFENNMVFKLSGEDHSNALNIEKAKLFDPSSKNRPMKEWVQVPFESKASWKKLSKAALNYVTSLQK